MARGYKQPAETLEWIAPSGGVLAGVPVIIGTPGTLAFPLGNAAVGEPFRTPTAGSYVMTKEPGLAITNGDTLYWDNTNKRITKTASTNVVAGIAGKSEIAGSSTVQVVFNVR